MDDRHNNPPPKEDAADPTKTPAANVGQLARRGLAVLMARQFAGQAITLFGGIALARLLTPAEFAAFAICVFFQGVFTQCSNAGLAGALIQQPVEPSDRELRVAFTTQLLLLTAVASVAFFVGPKLIGLYPDIESAGYGGLFAALVASMWIGALRSTPVASLERRLGYAALGGVEIVETFFQQVVAVTLAFAGWGVWALAVGVVTRAAVGTIGSYLVSGWRPGFAWDPQVAWRLLKFGAPLQITGLVQQFGRGVPALVIAPVVGATEFGLMLWGLNVGTKLQFLTGPLKRVAFPHLCRIDDPQKLATVYGRYLFLVVLAVGSWTAIVHGLGQSVLLAIYSDKWAGGLTAATLYTFPATIAITDAFALMLLNASGKPGRGLWTVGLRTASAFVIASLLVPWLGILAGPATWLTSATIATFTMSALTGAVFAKVSLRVLAIFFLSSVAAIGVQEALGATLGEGVAPDLLRTAVGVGCYFGAMLLLAGADTRRWAIAEVGSVVARATKRLAARRDPLAATLDREGV